jgi:UDP-N-acetylmuramoylalanine-D-glutamate ligase
LTLGIGQLSVGTVTHLVLIESGLQHPASGGTHVTMEVSSHALALGRVYGLRFHTALFTNLTRDHLDFHGTMEEYFAAKRLLFEGCGAPPPRFAGINLDDPRGRELPAAPETTRFGYGTGVEADVRAILGRLESHRLALLDLTDADADAYAQVGAAYAMPRDTDEQKAARTAAIQASGWSYSSKTGAPSRICDLLEVEKTLLTCQIRILIGDLSCDIRMSKVSDLVFVPILA